MHVAPARYLGVKSMFDFMINKALQRTAARRQPVAPAPSR